MIVIEVLLTVLAVVGLPVVLVAWITRPLWRVMVRRWRIEGEAMKLRQRNDQAAQALRERARAEAEAWLGKEGVGRLMNRQAEGLAAVCDPFLQALLERYPLDDRVQELARVYQQATGKELLPACLSASSADEAPPKALPAPLTTEEERLLAEARQEMEGWLDSSAPSEKHERRQEQEQ